MQIGPLQSPRSSISCSRPIAMTTLNDTSSVAAEAAPPAAAAAAATTTPTLMLQKLFHELGALEVFLALALFITIHSLRQRKPQGLPSWPLVGMLPSLILALGGGNVYEWITDVLRQRGGTFTFHGPVLSSLHCVVTADPRNLEHMLKTRFPSFPKGPYFRDAVRDLLGDGIFGADGEAWRRQRRAASLEFHSAGFRDMTAESLLELVHGRLIPVLDRVCEARGKEEAVDLQDVLLRLTFDNVCMIAFGVDPGCLRPGLPEIPFAKAFEEATAATVVRFVTPTIVWRLLRFFQLGPERKLSDCLKEVDEFAYGVIRTRKQELRLDTAAVDVDGEEEDSSSSHPNWKRNKSDLLTVFLKGRDEDGREYGDEFLRDVCVNFILAGRDTSSVALAWFFWLLGSHPEVEEEVLRELCRIIAQREDQEQKKEGDVMSPQLPADHREVVFRPEEVKKMEYLQAALSEALRLYPSVPVDHKEVIEDGEVFPDGTVLKKGTKVIYAIYAMGRMETIWGDDCWEFRPDRWLRDGRFVSESAYRFSAFNGGPRLCLGKDFAYYQMKFVAAAMLLRYCVRVVPGHPVAPKLALTMYMKHGLRVTLERREAGEMLTRYL